MRADDIQKTSWRSFWEEGISGLTPLGSGISFVSSIRVGCYNLLKIITYTIVLENSALFVLQVLQIVSHGPWLSEVAVMLLLLPQIYVTHGSNWRQNKTHRRGQDGYYQNKMFLPGYAPLETFNVQFSTAISSHLMWSIHQVFMLLFLWDYTDKRVCANQDNIYHVWYLQS